MQHVHIPAGFFLMTLAHDEECIIYTTTHSTSLQVHNNLLHGLQGLSSFYDGQILPTLFPKNNLTVMIEETNKTEAIFLISYGSEAEIVTPPAYACNASTSQLWVTIGQ